VFAPKDLRRVKPQQHLQRGIKMLDALYYGGCIGAFIAGCMIPPYIVTGIRNWWRSRQW